MGESVILLKTCCMDLSYYELKAQLHNGLFYVQVGTSGSA